MTKEEALKEARRLLKKSGVDTSEMTDAEAMAKLKILIVEVPVRGSACGVEG